MSYKYYISYNSQQSKLNLADFDLIQIGRLFCDQKTFYDNHYHSRWYELTVVTDGTGTVYTNNKPITVKKGDVYFSCLYDIHKIVSDKDNPLKYDFFSFYPKSDVLAGRLATIAMTLSTPQSRVFKDERISFLISNAIKELGNIEELTSPLLNGIFWQITTYIIRNFEKAKSIDSQPSNGDILCFQIMDYINSNLQSISSLNELSEIFKYSYNYLSALFKKTTSLTIIEYYNMLRLDLAKSLIEEDKLNLTQIAEQLNYSTPFSLSKAFKKRFNLSPSHLRKEAKQNKFN